MGTRTDALNARPDAAEAEALLARVLWVMGALWIFVQVQRLLVPALLGASPILADFGITANGAGLLAAIYYPIYGLMQIPSGLMADRGGLRRLLIWSCLVLGAAGVGFALAPSLALAVVARALVAAASSLFWVPGLKLCLQLSPRLYGRSVGIMVAVGSIGGITALVALPQLLSTLDWRTVSLLAALPLFPLAAAMLLLPEPPAQLATASKGLDLRGLWLALTDLRLWQLAWPAMMWDGMWFGLLTWWPRFGRDVMGVSPGVSGLLAAVATLALMPGSYLFGWLASHRGGATRPCFYLAQVASLAVLLALPLLGNRFGLAPVFLVVALLGALFGAFFLYMSLLAREFPAERVGTATGLGNCLTFLPAFVAPWLMGSALDLVDRPVTPDPVYSASAYAAAWLVAAAFLVVGLLGALAIKLWRTQREPTAVV